MLQQVARVGRLGSKALPSPTLGIRASMINLPMILIEDYTLNPAVRRLLTRLVEIQGMGKSYRMRAGTRIVLLPHGG